MPLNGFQSLEPIESHKPVPSPARIAVLKTQIKRDQGAACRAVAMAPCFLFWVAIFAFSTGTQ
jgi:hypothetical protein